MAVNKIQKFRTIEEVMTFLNGGIVGGKVSQAQGAPSNNAPGLNGLIGTSMTFILPTAVTVTFVPGTNSDPYTLLLKDIKAQIEAVIPAVVVNANQDGRLVIVEAAPSLGVAVAAASAGGYATVVGTTDLRNFNYGPGGTLDGLTLTLGRDGGGDLVVVFSAPVNPAAVVSQINSITQANGITASLNGNYQLVLQSSDAGLTATIEVRRAGGYAQIVGTADLGLLEYGTGGTLDTYSLIIADAGGVGDDVTTLFSAPGNPGEVVSQINTAISATSTALVASLNASNHLTLTSTVRGVAVKVKIEAASDAQALTALGLSSGASATGAATASTGMSALGLSSGTTTGSSANSANALLGFDTARATVGKVYSPAAISPNPPCWTWAYSGNDNMHACYTWE